MKTHFAAVAALAVTSVTALSIRSSAPACIPERSGYAYCQEGEMVVGGRCVVPGERQEASTTRPYTNPTSSTSSASASATPSPEPEAPKVEVYQGWTQMFVNASCAISGSGYNTYEQMAYDGRTPYAIYNSYNASDCFRRCDEDWAQSCQFVDMYYEDYAVAEKGPVLKCAMYADIHTLKSCNNTGELRDNVGKVDIRQSTGWANFNWLPPVINKYDMVFMNISKAMDAADLKMTKQLAQFIPDDCATLCNAAPWGCSFFNLYKISNDGENYVPMCELYGNAHHTISDCTKSGYLGFSVSNSYGWKLKDNIR